MFMRFLKRKTLKKRMDITVSRTPTKNFPPPTLSQLETASPVIKLPQTVLKLKKRT